MPACHCVSGDWHPVCSASPPRRLRGRPLPTQDEDGQPAVLLFGGQRGDGLLLNDVWRGALSLGGEEGSGWPSCRVSVLLA